MIFRSAMWRLHSPTWKGQTMARLSCLPSLDRSCAFGPICRGCQDCVSSI